MQRRGMAAVFILASAIRLSIFSSAELREAIAARVEVPPDMHVPNTRMAHSVSAISRQILTKGTTWGR